MTKNNRIPIFFPLSFSHWTLVYRELKEGLFTLLTNEELEKFNKQLNAIDEAIRTTNSITNNNSTTRMLYLDPQEVLHPLAEIKQFLMTQEKSTDNQFHKLDEFLDHAAFLKSGKSISELQGKPYLNGSSEPLLFKVAALSGYLNLIQYLLKIKTIDIEIYKTAYILAAQKGHLALTQFLGDLLPEADRKPMYAFAFRKAAKYGQLEIIRFLSALPGIEENSTSLNCSFKEAAINGHLETCQFIAQFPQLNQSDNNDILKLAAREGHFTIVKFLTTLPEVNPMIHGFDLIRTIKCSIRSSPDKKKADYQEILRLLLGYFARDLFIGTKAMRTLKQKNFFESFNANPTNNNKIISRVFGHYGLFFSNQIPDIRACILEKLIASAQEELEAHIPPIKKS